MEIWTSGRSVVTVSLIALLASLGASAEVDTREYVSNVGNGAEQVIQPRPLVFLAVLARNAAHLLSNFFGYLEALNYPKERIIFEIYTDHNADNTSAVFREWAKGAESVYNRVVLHEMEEWTYESRAPHAWHEQRYVHVSKLRQEALDTARRSGADFFLTVDCDNFLTNPEVLNKLIETKKTIVAPMLVVNEDITFSNFWCGQNEKGYYRRTPDYFPTLSRSRRGCLLVHLVHSTMLVNIQMEASRVLQYWPPPNGFEGEVDDIIMFAFSARKNNVNMYLLNTEEFGYMMNPVEYASVEEGRQDFINYKLKQLVSGANLSSSRYISPPLPEGNDNLDAVMMISLVRRHERRQRMLHCLNALGFDYVVFDAIDGRNLNETYLQQLGIHYLPGWKDPWGERPMTYGEVGCFLSHYFIWLKMLAEELQQVLVLEDDVDFEPNFRRGIRHVLDETESVDPEWDLIYIGRKALNWKQETLIPGTENLVKPSYSYWTLSYIISLRGAKKLIEGEPFGKMLPVDEYIPIMFDRHPERDWVEHFQNRNLRAYSVYPLLAFPTHYVGDEEWFSDTEPPPEVLEQIRLRKLEKQKAKEAEMEEERKPTETDSKLSDTESPNIKTEL